MSTVLVLASSILGEQSASNALLREAVEGLRRADPGLRVIQRDLGAEPVPHLDGPAAAALRGAPAETAAQRAALALSDAIVEEVRAADLLLIGAPMYNFGIPSGLKAWFDHLLRAGVTFRYTEAGPEGLLPSKRAIVVESRGGLYSEGPAQAMDAQEPHLRALLRFVGVADVTFVRAERLALGPEPRQRSLAEAARELAAALETERRRLAA